MLAVQSKDLVYTHIVVKINMYATIIASSIERADVYAYRYLVYIYNGNNDADKIDLSLVVQSNQENFWRLLYLPSLL